MEKKEILVYYEGICVGLYPVEKVLYDSYPITVYGDVVIFDNDPPVSVLCFTDVDYGVIIDDDLMEKITLPRENVMTSEEIKSAMNCKYGIIGIDLSSEPDTTSYPGGEYLLRFANSNHMSIERAKEHAICKECLKYYEEENNE